MTENAVATVKENNVAATAASDDTEARRALAARLGQDGSTSQALFPMVAINTYSRNPETKEKYPGDSLGMFTAVIDGKRVFAPNMRLRPVLNRFQYRRYDKDKGETVNKTVLCKTMFNASEFYDELGTTKCGRLTENQKEGATPEQIKVSDQVSAYRYVFGIVEFVNAIDVKGDSVELEQFEAMLRLRGTNFMPIGEIFDEISEANQLMIEYKLDAETEYHVRGDNEYYVINFSIDMEEKHDITDEVIDSLTKFEEVVKSTNDSVMEKYYQSLNKGPQSSDADLENDVKTIEGTAEESLAVGDDLDDEVPL